MLKYVCLRFEFVPLGTLGEGPASARLSTATHIVPDYRILQLRRFIHDRALTEELLDSILKPVTSHRRRLPLIPLSTEDQELASACVDDYKVLVVAFG